MVAEPIIHSLLHNISFRTDCLTGPKFMVLRLWLQLILRLLKSVVGCNITWYGRQILTFGRVMLYFSRQRIISYLIHILTVYGEIDRII
jgi:hypothetical protein